MTKVEYQPNSIVLTGLTGLIGSKFAEYVLENTDSKVNAIVRPNSKTLEKSNIRNLLEKYNGRIELIPGDVSNPELVDKGYRSKISGNQDFWHFAGNTSLKNDRFTEKEVISINHKGTLNVIKSILNNGNNQKLFYISTAYVAGKRKDKVYEYELDLGQEFNNPYELSKMLAEKEVRSATRLLNLEATIFRPSIVMGNSLEDGNLKVMGLYGPIIAGGIAIRRKEKRLTFKMHPEATLDVVPLDWVIKSMTYLANSKAVSEPFHLTASQPTNIKQILERSKNYLSGLVVDFNPDIKDEDLSAYEKRVNANLLDLEPYVKNPVNLKFDRERTNSSLPEEMRDDKLNLDKIIEISLIKAGVIKN